MPAGFPKKAADMDLHCLHKRVNPGSAGQWLKCIITVQ